MNLKRINPGLLEHWHSYFEHLQLSSLDFYKDIQTRLAEREYPDIDIRHVNFGNMFVGMRTYLRVRHRLYDFYICAAPFGKSYFVSWWMHERISDWAYIPILNWFVSTRKSLYQLDTELVFKAAVKAAVSEAVDRVIEEKGLRKLSDEELKTLGLN